MIETMKGTKDVREPVAIHFDFSEPLYTAEALAEAEKRGRLAMKAEIVAMLRDLARTDKESGHKPEAVALFVAAHQADRMS
jgi:hypothetical protein